MVHYFVIHLIILHYIHVRIVSKLAKASDEVTLRTSSYTIASLFIFTTFIGSHIFAVFNGLDTNFRFSVPDLVKLNRAAIRCLELYPQHTCLLSVLRSFLVQVEFKLHRN